MRVENVLPALPDQGAPLEVQPTGFSPYPAPGWPWVICFRDFDLPVTDQRAQHHYITQPTAGEHRRDQAEELSTPGRLGGVLCTFTVSEP